MCKLKKENDYYIFLNIAHQPFSFESVDFIQPGHRRCVSGSESIYCRVINQVVEIMTIIERQDLENIQ